MADNAIYRCVYEGGRVYVGTAEEIHRVYGLKPATIAARAKSRHCIGGVWTRRIAPNPLAMWLVVGYRLVGTHASLTNVGVDTKDFIRRTILSMCSNDTYYWADEIKPTMFFMDRDSAERALSIAIRDCQRHQVLDPHVTQLHVID